MRRLTSGHLDVWYAITCAITITSVAQADGYDFQVFELVVGRHLFEYVAYPKYNLDAPAGHLWQMMCFTGERFMPEQLDRSDLATQYFDNTCLSSPDYHASAMRLYN
jgi:peroxiredoxin family protein